VARGLYIEETSAPRSRRYGEPAAEAGCSVEVRALSKLANLSRHPAKTHTALSDTNSNSPFFSIILLNAMCECIELE
jgi:hypothetical protein